MMKRTGAYGAASSVSCHSLSVSKIVDFMSAEPFGSALFVCGENREIFSC